MLTRWDVLDYVAHRYGKVEAVFDLDARKLQLLREGKIDLNSLELNPERYSKRMAREKIKGLGLERIIGVSNFQDIIILDKLRVASRSICRLLKRGEPLGTGFLIGDSLLMTNHHVIERADDTSDVLAEFDYELTNESALSQSATFRLNPQQFFLTSSLEQNDADPISGLDFTIVAIEPVGIKGEKLSSYPIIPLDGNLGKIIKGEPCVIIQHPQGLPKKIVLTGNAFFSETQTRLVYETDTLPGSSGAGVFGGGTGELIALHHSGLPRTDDQNRILTKSGQPATGDTPESEIDWIANEGIKVSCIINAIRKATLPQEWESARQRLLQNTIDVSGQLAQSSVRTNIVQVTTPQETNVTQQNNTPSMNVPPSISPEKASFQLIAQYDVKNILQLEKLLALRYPAGFELVLSMPATAVLGASELFSLQVVFAGNVFEEARSLAQIPGVEFVEADIPLSLNASPKMTTTTSPLAPTESAIIDDGLGEWDEPEFLNTYAASPYVKGQSLSDVRKWNWTATGFNKLDNTVESPSEKGIRIVQFDTGYSEHSKVKEGFDYEQDWNFINNSNDAIDPRTTGVLKHPGHGTRTGSLLIGKEPTLIAHEGNSGLLHRFGYKLVPYRIAETVVIINRQRQLAAALDRALSQGFDIITMSMGLPPTITTAKLAKRAYDKGVIWCCAAGNEVQAVVAPAVYPGTIAVAASNPLDKAWKGSSRGDAVDITAPGEDVYVPIWNKEREEDFAYGNGTSYATPHIAAAAAYWLAKYHDKLSTPAYEGWKRVEAFRQALYQSARKEHDLPSWGFGEGILDIEKLLKTKPMEPGKLKYAYNNYDEHAFLATLQAYGDVAKTYWNKIHGFFFGRKEESMMPAELTGISRQLERSLFGSDVTAAESTGMLTKETLLARYQEVNNIILEKATVKN